MYTYCTGHERVKCRTEILFIILERLTTVNIRGPCLESPGVQYIAVMFSRERMFQDFNSAHP